MARALGTLSRGWYASRRYPSRKQHPQLLVEQTPHYTLNLPIGPVQPTVSAMDAMQGMTGDVAVNGVAEGARVSITVYKCPVSAT